MSKNTVRSFFKNLIDLLFVGLVIFALTSCASGGGSSGVAPSVAVAPQPSSTPTDQRVAFNSWTDTYSPNNAKTSDTVSVVYDMTAYTTTGLPAKTEKYYIEDYGFFRTTINGETDRCNGAVEECTSQTNFFQHYNVFESDINGDGAQDFYLIHWAGDGNSEWIPNSNLFAWINDGNGHFTLDQSVFAEGTPCFMGSECGNNFVHSGMLVADFNGDGMDDIYQNQHYYLSDNGKLYNKSSDLPSIGITSCKSDCFTHDSDAGDADGDGDLDIFLPIWDTYADESKRHLGTHPWVMMINDGIGGFTANTNFPSMGKFGDNNFATAAVIADFDNDGHGDVAVSWQRPGLSTHQNTVTNSAGAVFYNDGNNDWRNRTVVELPANYFGANGLGNDIEAFDFDGDGFIDIVLGTTKNEPYYDGRYIQFFKNVDGTSFIDVSSTANANTKYVNGLGNGYWNGDGDIKIIDFDHDGDLDVVDQVRGTYVLLNNGDGTYTMYDDFPQFSDTNYFYPVEIDGKFWYDFIGSTNTSNGTNQDVLTFFQVLDPPSFDEMYRDIATKPQGYAKTVFESKLLFDNIRRQTRGNALFTETKQDSYILGFNKELNHGYGFLLQKSTGDSNGFALTVDREIGRWHTGFSYINNKLQAQNDTMWFGTGNADLEYTTISQFVEYLKPINKNMFGSFGFEVSRTEVEGFTEQFSDYNVNVDKFETNDAKLFADVNYRLQSKLGFTLLTAGVDHYKSITPTSIRFADVMTYRFKDQLTVGKLSVQHNWKSFYFKGNFNTESLNSFEVGFNLTF